MSTRRVLLVALCLALILIPMKKSDGRRIACSKDIVSQAKTKLRNIKRAAVGRPALRCETPSSARFLTYP